MIHSVPELTSTREPDATVPDGAAVNRPSPGARWRTLVLALAAAVAMYADQHEARRPGVVAAYIDPGSGSLALQLVAALFVGLLFYVRRLREIVSRTWAAIWRRRRS